MLLANKNYRKLLAAQFESDFGDGVYALGLLWAMKQLTDSAVMVSTVLIAEIVPLVVLGVFAGVFVDMGSKKRIMILSDLAQGFVVTCLALVWWLDLLRPWMLILAAVLLSSFSAFFTPARTVTVRTLVGKEMIVQAQSLQQTTNTLVGLSAPALAAILLSVDTGFAFAFNAVSFYLSFFFIFLIQNEEICKRMEQKADFGQVWRTLPMVFVPS
jgi:DHA3 family macrolide efflux protein-like MFS transporter